MTASSEHVGFVRGIVKQTSAGDWASADVVRDGFVNNANHLLDERGPIVYAFTGRLGQYRELNPVSVVGRQYYFAKIRPRVFPHHFRPGGVPFKCSVHARISASTNDQVIVKIGGIQGTPPFYTTTSLVAPYAVAFTHATTTAASYSGTFVLTDRSLTMPLTTRGSGGALSSAEVSPLWIVLTAESEKTTTYPRIHSMHVKVFGG